MSPSRQNPRQYHSYWTDEFFLPDHPTAGGLFCTHEGAPETRPGSIAPYDVLNMLLQSQASRHIMAHGFCFKSCLYRIAIYFIAMVGYKNPATATQSGHWLPQPCIAWNKINKYHDDLYRNSLRPGTTETGY